jgi:DNA-binding MarR family transcriptional regulator
VAGERIDVRQFLASLQRNWPSAAAQVEPAVLLLYRARDRLFDDLTDTLKPHALRPADLDVLVALRTQPAPRQLTPTVLYRSLLLSSGGLTKILHRLTERGLIARPANPEDRRSRLVRLTGAGERLLDRLFDDLVAHERRFVAPLSPAERGQLEQLLGRLIAGGCEERYEGRGPRAEGS